MLDDSAVWKKKGAGVADDTTSKNRQDYHKYHKEDAEFDLMEFDNNLHKTLQDMGMNEEALQRCGELFFEAVAQRLFHEDSEFRTKVIEILNDFTTNPFHSDETIDVAEALANRIEELETQIAYVENENRQLYDEVVEALHEENEQYNDDLRQK